MKFPKHQYIRSKALLQNARMLPCQICGIDDGTVVAAHTNWGGGKGRSIKADDNLIASLCFKCHTMIDQGHELTKEEKKQFWHKAHCHTISNLLKLGLYPDDLPLPKGEF